MHCKTKAGKQSYQGIGSCTHTPTTRLYAKEIIQKSADKVVVQEATSVWVTDQEGENRQTLFGHVTQYNDIRVRGKHTPSTSGNEKIKIKTGVKGIPSKLWQRCN